jgi:nanoRNase/pAp phosphatase (c-di-AMP/oligoRNAs hydrolase)
MSSAFVTSCIDATAGSAARVDRKTWRRPRVQQLMRQLNGKRNILVTTHEHPDPDALASSIGLSYLLEKLLPDATITTSFKGRLGGGLNRIFAQYSLPHYENWDQIHLDNFDAICLLDCQPTFTNTPLPPDACPVAVIDHHPALRGQRCRAPFVDVRRNVGASSSIVFGYFMEKDIEIPKDIAALMLYGIESDLAGAAGQPGDLDNVALSTLTLVADMRKLYRIRFVDLPQSYYIAYFSAMKNAVMYDHAMLSHLEMIDSPEQPAVMADFLLRFEEAQWVLVTAISGRGLVLSLRTTSESTLPAGSIITRIVRHIGQGGGHPTKAGGYIPLPDTKPETLEKYRCTIKRRFISALNIRGARPQRLIPRAEVAG